MKIFIAFLFLQALLFAESYTFSGGNNNTAHIIATKILTKVYDRAGIDVSFHFGNLQESLEKSDRGVYDGEISRIKIINKKYKNLMMVPVSTLNIEAVAFSKDKNLKINSFADLKGKKFAIVRGAKFIEYETKDMNKVYKKSFKEAIESLEKGEIDIAVLPKLAGLTIVYEHNYRKIRIVGGSLISLKLYHFVHKKNAHIIPIITPILQKMQKSGELSYIKRSHLRRFIQK